MDFLTIAVVVAQALTSAAAVPTAIEGPVRTTRFPAIVAPAFRALPALTAPGPLAPRDTVFEYSAAYYKRLDIHRIGSYTMLPLFAFQYIAGTQLYDRSFEAPGWAKTGHRVAATGVAVLFGVNTVTGLMNLYEGRKDPEERGRRIFHALMMLAADAGFAATGILAERAEASGDDRELHRTVALTSVGVATIGYLSMLDIFRRD
jgi:hypothetical protein